MHQIIEKYMLLVEKVSHTVRLPKSFDTGVDIYRSEIHIIQLVGDRTVLYVSEISKLIGVTKGTISQIVKRLETKGLVRKDVDLTNNTRQQVRLTAKGQVAYEAHCRYHKQKHGEMESFLQTLDAEKLGVLEDFLTHAHAMIEDHL